MVIPCEICGDYFAWIQNHYNTKVRRTCSQQCKNKLMSIDRKKPKRKISVVCSNCGVKFEVGKFRLKHKKTNNWFCSVGCFKKWESIPENNPNWHGGPIKTNCGYCGKLLRRSKSQFNEYDEHFCSKDCLARARTTLIEVQCECCGKTIERLPKYIEKYAHLFCDRSCRSAWMCGPNNTAWNGGTKSLQYCNAWTDEEYKSELKERDGNQCLNPYCKHKDTLIVLHHIDYDKQNCAPTNLISLCGQCNLRANVRREWHKGFYRSIMNKRYGFKYDTKQRSFFL